MPLSAKQISRDELVRSLFSADDSDRDLVWPPALSAADIQQKVLGLPPAATEELTLSIVEKVCGPDEVLKVQMWSKVDNFQRAVIAFYDVLGRLTPVSEMTAKDYVFEEKLVKPRTLREATKLNDSSSSEQCRMKRGHKTE